ncbi:MAG: glutathione peroxidase [Phycisphaerales bacterium]|nr:glutathione peroxidase [Phycisphaerales bacterium]
MLDIEGLPVSLSQYKGQVVMFVNVASKCGLTPQYEQLQALHTRYEPQGLRILGFPANNFMGQEPGTNEQILEFCSTRFGVTFPMFAKISVKGRDQHELYKWLTSETTNPGFAGEIDWNFAKFLVGRDGRVIARFTARTKPDDAKVIAAIEEALKAPAPQRS